ncbi:hypothetical protein SAMN05421803_112169 [Nocardiopsis flavescens]|uniref:Uncharacterized protein n=1 Tax=Nocardiopsis flavescens TaxID=758803 RepID=A0A1M6NYR0_9ACTN|nr:hypothetical protein [Nocardiopsis flavescens]SHK00784.1 hypothetical protein SAMN05421803_112169 [Nocardiopsis flavescens]
MPFPLPPLPDQAHRSTLYTDWVRLNDPGNERSAAEFLDGLPESARKLAGDLDRIESRAARAGLPLDHLPWLWDTVGHRLASGHPRKAGAAYTAARESESRHRLPVSPVHAVDNALLFARYGALPAKEVRAHWDRLSGLFPAGEAYREFQGFLAAWAAGGAALPADLVARLRAAASHAGLGPDEVGRALGRVLTARTPGAAASDRLLDAAAGVFARHPPEEDARTALVDLFPAGTTDGGAWLRLLDSLGLVDDLAQGRVVPDGGYAAWLSAFPRRYSQVKDGRYMKVQPMAAELHALVPRIADRVRAEGARVRTDGGRWWPVLDLGFAEACLSAGLAVADPDPGVKLRSRIGGPRDAVAADPRFAPHVPAKAARPGAAPDRAGVPGLSAQAAQHLDALDRALSDGTPAAGEEALEAVEKSLDGPAVLAAAAAGRLPAAPDPAVPLARALRFGVPAEYTWPAFEAAVAEFAARGEAVHGMSATWPVLTVYGRSLAIAVGPRGEEARAEYEIPEGISRYAVHRVGGDFVVGWPGQGWGNHRAFWCSDPDTVLAGTGFDASSYHGYSDAPALGYTFGDSQGRHGRDRRTAPGEPGGVSSSPDLLGDGTSLWRVRSEPEPGQDPLEEVDPADGTPTGRDSRPSFLPAGDRDWVLGRSSLAPLPEGVADSPLGAAGGLTGFRVHHEGEGADRRTVVEGVDGRRCAARGASGAQAWGVVRMPGGDLGLLTERRDANLRVTRCLSAGDGGPWWEVYSHLKSESGDGGSAGGRMLYPPPAFWHFLVPRDPEGSRALRGAGTAAARELLDAAGSATGDGARRDAVRAALARVLPGVSDDRLAGGPGGLVELVLRSAGVERRRARLSRLISTADAENPVPHAGVADRALRSALGGLLSAGLPDGGSPSVLTAVAADGAFLRGSITEATRRVAPPAPPGDWSPLLGRTDAALWRLAGTPAEEARAALTGFLRVWAGTPFAERGTRWRRGLAPGGALEPLCERGLAIATGRRGTGRRGDRGTVAPSPGEPLRPEEEYRFVQPAGEPAPEGTVQEDTVSVDLDQAARVRRLLELLAERGPFRAGDRAVRAFTERTGALGPLAALVLNGRLGLSDARPGGARARTNLAGEYDRAVRALGPDGLNRLLGAALPEDPADLWEPDGDVRAAERAAGVWAELLGVRTVLDADAVALIDKELKLDAGWVETLMDPSGSDVLTTDLHRVIAEGSYASPALFAASANGRPGNRIFHYDPATRYPYRVPTSLVAWPSARLPAGHPAAAGVPELYRRLVDRMRAPGSLVPVGSYFRGEEVLPLLEATGYERLPYSPHDEREPGRAVARVLGGPLLVAAVRDEHGSAELFVRTAGFFEPGAYGATEKALDAQGFRDSGAKDELALVLRGLREVCDGSLGRLAARTADSPVPAGGYEADPRLSAPEPVEEAAASLGTDADAAALYLQLLTLSRPTDQNVRRWNGWSAARHRKVSARLLETGAVEQDKRPRAGRTLFLPDGWVAPKSPDLPLEAAKLETHFAVLSDKKVLVSPTSAQLPLAPLHEMFARSWRSRGADG